MISLRDIQTAARDVIASAPYFSNEPIGPAELVVADEGLSKDDIENALNTRGLAVVVDFPLQAQVMHRTSGATHCYVTVPVHVQLNPVANASDNGAHKSILLAVDEVLNAFMENNPGDDEADRFEIEYDAIDLILNDAGLVAYVLWLRKLCVFAPMEIEV